MRLELDRIEVQAGGAAVAVRLVGDGVVTAGPLTVELNGAGGRSIEWAVTNTSGGPCAVRSVAVVFRCRDVIGPLRMLRQGYQSWTRTSVATFGRDHDPSTTPGSVEMMQGIHHADQRSARPGELRSEWVTVLQDDGAALSGGFPAAVEHDGTWRLRPGADGEPELWAEAFLGDAELGPGERRRLHPFAFDEGDDASALLDRWAREAGSTGRARVGGAYQVGWCSWYHYFHDMTEQDLDDNLRLAHDWPFEVFQLDDGYQAAIGDWLATNEKFPSRLDALAESIARSGMTPGIWLAPFIVAPDSQVATDHPEWLARFDDGKPLWGMFNPAWGGGVGGVMYALDTTKSEVQDHIEHVARSLVEAGFTYLKLDFTFAPSFDGVWADRRLTPAQRVRAGYEAVRRGAGEEAFLLGCGAPLSHVVGVVDGNRIGPDVAPSWELSADQDTLAGYEDVAPATLHAWVDTLSRSFMHRRLWLNDPDCLMPRTDKTAMSPDAVRSWANAVAVSGGMALVSDDLGLLGDEARALLDDVVSIGRAVDEAARNGAAPRCDDVMDHAVPRRLAAAGYELVGDPATATSTLTRPR